MLTTRFWETGMKDDESFNQFYTKLNDTMNSSFNPGEQILKNKL